MPKSSRPAYVISIASIVLVVFSVATVCKFFPWVLLYCCCWPCSRVLMFFCHSKLHCFKILTEEFFTGAETMRECSEREQCVGFLKKSDLAGNSVYAPVDIFFDMPVR